MAMKAFSTAGGNSSVAFHGTCKWCGNTFWSDSPKAECCPGTNHRVYYCKRRKKQLEKLWIEMCYVFSNYRLKPIQAMSAFESTKAEQIATALGFIYDDTKRRWITLQ